MAALRKKKKVRKKTAVKKGVGRPSKFDGINTQLVQYMYEEGATDKQVAKKIGVSKSTLDLWKLKHPEFSVSLKDWKLKADDEVEASLYKRACGYTCDETKVFCDAKTGKITTKEIKKHYAPSEIACFFWLKNRKPDNWRDKIEHGFDPENIKKIFAFRLDEPPKE